MPKTPNVARVHEDTVRAISQEEITLPVVRRRKSGKPLRRNGPVRVLRRALDDLGLDPLLLEWLRDQRVDPRRVEPVSSSCVVVHNRPVRPL